MLKIDEIKDLVLFLEEHGLINKVIDKTLTPEMVQAAFRGLGEGLFKGVSHDV